MSWQPLLGPLDPGADADSTKQLANPVVPRPDKMPVGLPRAACYDVPKWHIQQWRERSGKSIKIQDSLNLGEKAVAGYREFSNEMFHRLVSESPREIQEKSPEAGMREKLHAIANQLPEFEVLRKSVAHDPDWSAMACAEIIENLSTKIPIHDKKPDCDREKRILDGMHLSQSDMPGSVSDEELATQEGKLAGNLYKLAEHAQDLDESSMRVALRKAISKANQELDEAKQAGDAFGMGVSDPNTSLALARQVKNSPKLAKIMALAGRLKSQARAKRATKSVYARSELVGIEPTGSLENLLPSELACFTSSERTLDLIRRLGEKTALGYKLSGKEKLKQGPLIVMLDVSGSMADNNSEKDIWAKAVSLALLDIAKHEKRSFALGLFNSQMAGFILAEDLSKPFHPDKLANLMELMSRAPSGGTSFQAPITWGLECVGAVSKFQKFKNADLVLVTDGEADRAGASDAMGIMKQFGITCYGIGIGHIDRACLEAWTHEISIIDDVSKDTQATDLLFSKL